MQSRNPSTGDVVETYDEHSPEEVDDRLHRARHTFEEWWSERDITVRERLLADVADVLRRNEREYAELITTETGKPIAQSREEIETRVRICEHYAQRAAAHLQDEVVGSEASANTHIAYEPIGPVLGVMPWNFPFQQAFRFAAPSLTAGNVGMLKHASNVPGCALAVEAVFERAGYPKGVFTTLLVGFDRVADVISDDRIEAVTLTGSRQAGRATAETAGHELKGSVLELGGSDPLVVLDDAPLKETVYNMFSWVRDQPDCNLDGLMEEIDHLFLHSEGSL